MTKFLLMEEFSKLPGTLIYYPGENSFDFKPSSKIAVDDLRGVQGPASLLIASLQLEFGITTGACTYVWGYHPYNNWRIGSLPRIPLLSKGLKVVIDWSPVSGTAYGFIEIGEWQTIYDKTTGWIRLSSSNSPVAEHYVEFADNTVAAIGESGQLVSLWMKPTFDPDNTEVLNTIHASS